MTRSFFRCLICGHVTPYRGGPHGAVAHYRNIHDGISHFEHTEPGPGHAVLKRRYSDDWEDVDLTQAIILTFELATTWGLFITSRDGTHFIHGEWASRRTAENKRLELRKIGRAGQ